MEWEQFARGIKLSETLIQKIQEIMISEEKYREIKQMYLQKHEDFFQYELSQENPEMNFLAVYCRMACDTYAEYRKAGIEDDIFWATFGDINLWCENYYREYGKYGLGAYDWIYRHIDMTLFRLGRLQFEQMEMEYEVGKKPCSLEKGRKVINIHIPQGEALSWKECEKSLTMAFERYGTGSPYVCHSWLLYPGLKEVLDEKSRILQFQKHFCIQETDYKEREAEWRIFGKVQRNIETYPERTSLQIHAKQYLLEGKSLGNGWGVLIWS